MRPGHPDISYRNTNDFCAFVLGREDRAAAAAEDWAARAPPVIASPPVGTRVDNRSEPLTGALATGITGYASPLAEIDVEM